MNVDVGTVGVWLLVVSAVVIVVECALAGLWSIRLGRRVVAARERMAAHQHEIAADVERLMAALAETQALWEPYARLLRRLRHPIAIALMQSFTRRRRAVAR
jgi:hypothetical protein